MHRTVFALIVFVVVLTGCGPRNEPPPPAETTEAATSVALRLALDLPDTLQRAVERWADARRARVEWVAPGTIENSTLAEVPLGALHALATTGALRPMPEAVLSTQHLAAAGRVEGVVHGLPWRAELTALAIDGVAPDAISWPDLARRGESLVLVAGHESHAFLALAAASGAGIEAGVVHDVDLRSDPAVEALTFLRRLAVRARRVDADAAWPSGVDAVVLGSARRDAVPAGWAVTGLPGPESAEGARVLADVRVLVAPTSGDHGDLGIELATWIADPERASLLHANAADGLALCRDATADDATRAWLDLFDAACLPPTASADAGTWNATLDEAVGAAIERRRAPRAALDEAWSRR